jgi:hypothetical protein
MNIKKTLLLFIILFGIGFSFNYCYQLRPFAWTTGDTCVSDLNYGGSVSHSVTDGSTDYYKFYDTSWSTYATRPILPTCLYPSTCGSSKIIYKTYKKPYGFITATIEAKIGSNSQQYYNIPSACLSYDDEYLYIRGRSTAYGSSDRMENIYYDSELTCQSSSSSWKIITSDLGKGFEHMAYLYNTAINWTTGLAIDSPSSQTYLSSNQYINLTNTTEIDTMWYNWNGTNVTYETPILTSFSSGTHTLTAWANNSDNEIISTERTFTIQLIPAIEIITPINTDYCSDKITLNISTENADYVWYNYNGTNVTYERPITLNLTKNESYTINVWANNSYGINNDSISFNTITPNPSPVYVGNGWYEINYSTTGSHNFCPSPNVTSLKILMVAGGGGSSLNNSVWSGSKQNGGGAGGLIWIDELNIFNLTETQIYSPNSIPITLSVGKKGNPEAFLSDGTSGQDTIFGSLTAKGGGGAGAVSSESNKDGRDGGSGGGAGGWWSNVFSYKNGNPGLGTQTSQPSLSGLYGYGNDGNTQHGGGALGTPNDYTGLEAWGRTLATGGRNMETNPLPTLNIGDGGSVNTTTTSAGGNGIVIIRYYITPPEITFNSPLNGSFHSTNTLLLNVTTNSEENTLWYTWEGSNHSYTPFYFIFDEGENIMRFWVNNSEGTYAWEDLYVTIDSTPPQNVNVASNQENYYLPDTIELYCNYTDAMGSSALAEINWANGTSHNYTMTNMTLLNANPIQFYYELNNVSDNGIHSWKCIATDEASLSNESSTQNFYTMTITTNTTKEMNDISIGFNYNSSSFNFSSDYNLTELEGTFLTNLTFISSINHTFLGNSSESFRYFNHTLTDSVNSEILSFTDLLGNDYIYNLYSSTNKIIEYNLTLNESYHTRQLNTSLPITFNWGTDSTYRYLNFSVERVGVSGKYVSIGIVPDEEWYADAKRINLEVYLPSFGEWFTIGTYSGYEENNISAWGIYNLYTEDTDTNGLKDTLHFDVDLNSTYPRIFRFSIIYEKELGLGETPPIILPPTPITPGGGITTPGGGGTPIEPVEVFKKLPSETEIKETFVNIDNVLKQMVFGIPLAIILGLLGLLYAGYKYQIRRIDTSVFIGLIGGLTLIISYINLVR